MLTRLLVNRLLVNIAYMKIWVHLTFVLVYLKKKLGAPVQPVQKVSLEPWYTLTKNCYLKWKKINSKK